MEAIVTWYIRSGRKNAKLTLRRVIESGSNRSDTFYATLNTNPDRSIERALALIAKSEFPLTLPYVGFFTDGAHQGLNPYEDLEQKREQERAEVARRQDEYNARQAEWEAKKQAELESGRMVAAKYESKIDQKVDIFDLTIVSIKPSEPEAQFFTVKYTTKRADGLLVWFSTTSVAFSGLNVGDSINIQAKITGVKENFVFCKRPKLLQVVHGSQQKEVRL
jgi:hypothetical protein